MIHFKLFEPEYRSFFITLIHPVPVVFLYIRAGRAKRRQAIAGVRPELFPLTRGFELMADTAMPCADLVNTIFFKKMIIFVVFLYFIV